MSKFERKDVEHAMTEVLVLSNMHHPNVVSHKESWVDGQFLFLVMEVGHPHTRNNEKGEGRLIVLFVVSVSLF